MEDLVYRQQIPPCWINGTTLHLPPTSITEAGWNRCEEDESQAEHRSDEITETHEDAAASAAVHIVASSSLDSFNRLSHFYFLIHTNNLEVQLACVFEQTNRSYNFRQGRVISIYLYSATARLKVRGEQIYGHQWMVVVVGVQYDRCKTFISLTSTAEPNFNVVVFWRYYLHSRHLD